MQSSIWKKLETSRQGILDSDKTSKSKSKSKKFIPKRTSVTPDQNQRINCISVTSLISQPPKHRMEHHHKLKAEQAKAKPITALDPSLFNSIKGSQLAQVIPGTKMKVLPSFESDQTEMNSPTTILKHLNSVEKKQSNQMPVRSLFSLDEQHRYIYKELVSIKTAFAKLKQEVETQLIRQHQYVKGVVSSILSEFQKMLQACGKQHEIVFKIHQQETEFQGLDIHQISEINAKDSQNNDSKFECKNSLFGEQYAKLEKLKDFELSTNLHQSTKVQGQKSNSVSKSQTTKQRFSHNVNGTIKLETKTEHDASKSKREFVKLFEAVNCLKRDIKEIKGMSHAIKTGHPSMSQSDIGIAKLPIGYSDRVNTGCMTDRPSLQHHQKL